MGLDIIAISKIVKIDGEGGIRVGADPEFNRIRTNRNHFFVLGKFYIFAS
jgi:hypothetical protein